MLSLKNQDTVFINEEDKNDDLKLIVLLILTFSLPYDLFYSSILFITFCALTLLNLKKSYLKRIPKQFWVFQGIYFLGVIGYFYSLHKSDAGFLLERQLTIFLMPIIIPISIKITSERLKKMLEVLTISCLIAIIYLFINMSYTIYTVLHLPFVKTVFSGAFFNHQFSRPLDIHAGYLSLYVALSIIYLVTFTIKQKFGLKIIIASICLVILLAGLLFLASRNAIISTLFVLIFVFPFYHVTNKLRYLIVSTLLLFAVFFLVKKVPYLNTRFSIELISEIKSTGNGEFINYSATEPRIKRWECAMDLIKESPAFGYGTGDEIEMLKTRYAIKGLFISYLENFNTHNQYLSFWVKNGFIGLIIFISLFFYYIYLAIKNRDFMYLSFLLLLMIGFYTENILDANKGILFFAIFNTFFGYSALSAINKTKV
ncbi:O-antigen ligase family protein [Aurantibacillus circumpalustris]|uniref:O-antigen ligase family protein n=1 Tax=Aurantibacillus circumpalustris TaxID=3036359 RepID=UPI00295AE37B|nr:O-antigen ligase family protein [Aurantibacillus circumpalustris]